MASDGLGAGAAGADMLQEILKQKFAEVLARKKIAEDARQADLQHGIHLAQVGQGQQKIDQDTSQFGQTFGLDKDKFGFEQKMYNEAAPARAADLAHTTAQTGEILRQPSAEALARGFTHGENAARLLNASQIAQGHNATQIAVAKMKPEPLATVQTVDENGNPVTRFVKKEAGDSYAKAANATTAARVASAKTVNEVGDDLIRKLSDPQFKAVVGPVLGRAGTLRDFIGNPPPEFSELAGQIESYSIANMGVHGMRSAQGAEMIKKLLDQRHTPESLAATIRGLNDFSHRFVENNTPKSGGQTSTAAAPAGGGKLTPDDYLKKYGGG